MDLSKYQIPLGHLPHSAERILAKETIEFEFNDCIVSGEISNQELEDGIYKNKEKLYKPKQGRRLTFRGDMDHSVEPFFCDYTTKRISLVFEQYKIPDKYIHETEFNIDER